MAMFVYCVLYMMNIENCRLYGGIFILTRMSLSDTKWSYTFGPLFAKIIDITKFYTEIIADKCVN